MNKEPRTQLTPRNGAMQTRARGRVPTEKREKQQADEQTLTCMGGKGRDVTSL
jgi:hypothetical protein